MATACIQGFAGLADRSGCPIFTLRYSNKFNPTSHSRCAKLVRAFQTNFLFTYKSESDCLTRMQASDGREVHNVRGARAYYTDVGKRTIGGGLELWQGLFQ